jgi:cysteinyl-tRNA synthetase
VIRLHDTATGTVRELALREPGKVSMYVCGPTVYGPPHLGHGRFSLVFDVLRRYLAWSGLDVTYVSNITDIDDKIIDRAAREGREWVDIATKCESIWWKAMAALNVARPDHDPHATAYVAQMVRLIADLIDRDAAYVTDDGVYLAVAAVEGYGLLAHQSLEEMLAGGGDREVFGAANKRNPADFALWKFTKPGEPAWPSPWGEGRPGWHTECVVMSLDLLGEGFDIHGGGQDLAFPHHENERAQAVALGRAFATHWVHNGFVVDTSGEKMSKSLGNVKNLVDLVETYDPRAYRLLVLRAHYRSPLVVDAETLADAEAGLRRIDAFAQRTASLPAADADADTLARYREAMDDDLNTPRALAVLFEAIRAANAALDAGDPAGAAALAAAVRSGLDAVGLVAKAAEAVPAEATAKAAALDAARAGKDYATADRLRAELQADGWLVETTREGTTLRRP